MAPISLFCGSNGQRTQLITESAFRISFNLDGKLTMTNPGAYANPGTQDGGEEQGFRRCFADGLNQSLVSSAAQAKF